MLRASWPLVWILLAAAPASSEVAARDDGAALTLDGLAFDLAVLLEGDAALEPITPWREDGRHAWRTHRGEQAVAIQFRTVPAEPEGFDRPEEVLHHFEDERYDETVHEIYPFYFQDEFALPGAFGRAPYAWIGVHSTADRTSVSVAGLTEEYGYALELECEPPLAGDELEALLGAVRGGCEYDGDEWDPEWTLAEAEERWYTQFPERVRDDDELGLLRTDHFIVLTNMRSRSGSARKFAKVLEEYFEEVEEIFPFERVDGMRLMPVYLFQTKDDFTAFLMGRGYSRARADRLRSYTSDDYYATYYEAPNDPDYRWGVVQLVFEHYLRLKGGGYWFFRGTTEHLQRDDHDLDQFGSIARSGKQFPLRELMSTNSFSAMGSAGHEYTYGERQAACVIEFARDSDWGEGKFREFLYTVGRVPDDCFACLERALRSVYGVGFDEFEEAFLEYWRDRR